MDEDEVVDESEAEALEEITAAYHNGDLPATALLDALLGDATEILAAIEAGEYDETA